MQTDYYDAHSRHWQDAEQLFQTQRWANADHLYGLAAECGLKALMLKFGMKFDSSNDWPENEKDRKHADRIWARYESYRSGRVSYDLPSDNPFQDWHVSQRYANQANFNKTLVESHRKGAELVYKLIKQAQQDGLII